VLVLRSGETDRAMAEEKLKLVDRLPSGCWSGAQRRGHQQSGYKYYTYVYGYAAEDDPAQIGAGA